MLIKNNPAMSQFHDDWRQRIRNKFSDINFSTSPDYLCLIHYLDKAPQKFYSNEAFKQYLYILEEIKLKDPKSLANILIDAESLLSISNKILTEINDKSIHDIHLPKDHNDLIDFIDREIHYNLLKLYETPFFQFSKIIAKYYWIKNNKVTDGLDLYNAVTQIKKVGFDFVESIYLHDVRNGIAHGKIIFSDLDITYIDKKGNNAKISTRKIIDTLDGTLDITNGFCLAFKVFCLTNSDFFKDYSVPIPQSILLEELQAKANGPDWTITNCLDSVALNDRKQLMIYVKNDNWSFEKVLWYAFTSALWAEALTKSYDRIFFSLHSKHAKISPVGFAAYDARKMRQLRETNAHEFGSYKGVLEGDLLYFVPKIKFPKFIYTIGTYKDIAKSIFPLAYRNYIDTYFPNPFYIRDTKIHRKKNFVVVEDTSVIIKANFLENSEDLIRKNRKKIVNLAIRYSRKKCSRLSITRYLGVQHIRVFIYDTDKRVRNFQNSWLIPELIATIEVNTTKHIRTIDILGGTPEQIGKYRIVWNRKWIEKKETTANTHLCS